MTKRKPDESPKNYKLRREREEMRVETALRPRLFWNSYGQGTYMRPETIERKRQEALERKEKRYGRKMGRTGKKVAV